jgi:malonate transporter
VRAADLFALAGALVPVFLLIALGRLLARGHVLDRTAADGLSRLLFFVALPVQIAVVVGRADLSHGLDLRMVAAALAAFIAASLIAWWAAGRLDPARRGSFTNGAARPNGAFIGLPVVLLAAPAFPAEQAAALPGAYAVLLAVMVPAFNITAVLAFRLPHARQAGGGGWWTACAEIPRNPIIAGCLGGIAIALWRPVLDGGPPWWQAFAGQTAVTAGLVAQAAVPLALIATGAQLDLSAMRRDARLLAGAAVLKLAVAPALALAAAWALGCSPAGTAAVVVLLACPAAMASVPMARLLGGDAALMAALVTATTVAAPPALFAWLAFVRYAVP